MATASIPSTTPHVPVEWVTERIAFLRELAEKTADHGIGAGLESAALVLETELSSHIFADRIGYRCKQCSQPSPVGVGYTDYSDGAAQASQGLTACECGWSQLPGGAA